MTSSTLLSMSDSFLDLLFETPEQRRLRALRGDVERAAEVAAAYHAQESASSESMATQLATLRKEVGRLTVMVSVLAEALGQSGAIDLEWAGPRLQEQLQRLYPPKPQAPVRNEVTPAREHPRPEPIPVRLVVCERCRKKVDSTTTYVTETGVCCGDCYGPR